MNTRGLRLVPLACAAISGAILLRPCLARPSICGLESVKLLHRMQEPIVLHARVIDAHDATMVELWAQAGVEPAERVLTRPLAEVVKQDVLTIAWTPTGREFGLALTLRLLGEDGRVLTTAGPVVVEVSDHWEKMVRLTTIHAWRQLEPGFPEQQITEFLERQKRDHVNAVEIYEFKCNCGSLTPPPLRRHDAADSADKSRRTCWLSSATARKWIEYGKARGIRVIGYCNMVSAPESVFDKTGRVYARVQGRLEPVKNPWWKDVEWYVPNSHGFGKVFGDELARSVREYGWDGWFLDSAGVLFSANATGLDADGKPLSSRWQPDDWQGDSFHDAWDEKADEFLGDLNAELKRQGVSPVLICNAMSEAMWRGVGGAYWKRLNDIYTPFRQKGVPRDGRELFLGAQSSRHRPVWFAEYSLDGEVLARNAPWSYWQVATCMRSVRDAGRTPLVYHLHLADPAEDPQTYSSHTLKPLLATVLANGLGVSAITQPMAYQPPEDSEANLAIRQYYGFAARYGAYLYDLEWQRTPADAVRVETPDNVLWREMAFQRPGTQPREMILHLINLSGPPRTTTIVGSHVRPAVLRDVPVSLRWDDRPDPAVWYVSADGDQNPMQLPVRRKGDRLLFTVPELAFWTMVVVKTVGNR